MSNDKNHLSYEILKKKKDPFRHMLDWKLFASSWKKGKQNGWKDDEKLWFWMKILQN